MDSTNQSSFYYCGPVEWPIGPSTLTILCVTFSVLSLGVGLVNVIVSKTVREDIVKKAISYSAHVTGILVGAFVLQTSLLQRILDQSGKSLKMCLLTQALQILLVIEFMCSVLLYFLIPLLILSKPPRQTVLEQKSRLLLLFALTFGAPAVLVVMPLVFIMITTDEKVVLCCGWHLFPSVYIYSLIYGVLFPMTVVIFCCSARMVYLAKQKAKQTVVPVSQGHIDNTAVLASSRRKQRRQCKWISMAVIHFFVDTLPNFVLIFFYSICPTCIHSEFMLLVVNLGFVFVTVVLGLSHFIFREHRDAFRKLYLQCLSRNVRVVGEP